MPYLACLLLLGLAWFTEAGSVLAAGSPVWSLDARLDPTNLAYPVEGERVTVDLALPTAKCPSGLGQLADNRPEIRQVDLLYSADAPATRTLLITWNPGGSGQEQFEVLINGAPVRRSLLRDGATEPEKDKQETFALHDQPGRNTITLRYLSGDGLHIKHLQLWNGAPSPAELAALAPPAGPAKPAGSTPPAKPASSTPPTSPVATTEQGMKPGLPFPDLQSYVQELHGPGVLIEGKHVLLFAPASRKQEATIIHGYLVKAYDTLYQIVGQHTPYKIVVYHFPKSNPHGWGGTSECVIEYPLDNLLLDQSEEWRNYHVPHVSGYIEEMAHNFVGGTHAQFGWEMVGWSLGIAATKQVADNPIFERELAATREGQARTFERYCAAGFTFPADIEPNQCDRIHAWLLNVCEQQYGPAFWPDFFKEIRRDQGRLADAVHASGDDNIRNARYQITVECFDRLPRLQFKKMLEQNGISPTVDIKSLHPTDSGWSRKFR